MMDEQKDERQLLKTKIKQLQQEIVERTRNFMQSNRSRPAHMAYYPEHHIRTQQKHTQTDQLQDAGDKIENNKSNGEPSRDLNVWYKQYEQDWNLECLDDSQILKKSDQNKQGMDITKNHGKQIESMMRNGRKYILDLAKSLILLQLTNCNHNDRYEKFVSYFNEFKTNYASLNGRLTQYLSNLSSHANNNRQKQPKQDMLMAKISSLQNRCDLITKMLNQSEQANYQLRLQIQQNEIKYRQETQKIVQYNRQLQNCEQLSNQMKGKIEQMEIIKGEYLRAYSNIKEQKQQIQLKFVDLQEEYQNLKNAKDREYSKSQSPESNLTLTEDEDARLKTIIQHSEDEIIEEVIKQTSSGNSIEAIRQIIEHGLMQTNRSTSEKWIKSALIKLEQYELNRQQELQKRVESQTNLQVSVHEKYRIMFNNIMRINLKQKNTMQQNFNKAINRIIHESEAKQKQFQTDLLVKQANLQLKVTPKLKKSSIQRQMNDLKTYDELSESQKNCTSSQSIDLISKLNQSNHLYAQLKKKYDALIEKKQKQLKSSPKIPKTKNNNEYFSQFMEKLIKNQTKVQKKFSHHKFTEQFFDKVSQKVFQTLCHFPIGDHGQVFFIPTNQQQLEDALQVIYKFSLSFDDFQEARLRQFKNEAQSLTKVFEQIAVAKQIPAEMVIQSVKNNIKDENSLMGTYVKSMIRKISSENQAKKKLSEDSALKLVNLDQQL